MIGEKIRWAVLTLVTLGAGGYVYYIYLDTRPCVHPVEYSIGSVDPRFGTSNEDLRRDLQAASDIWSNTLNRTLFVENDTDGLPINLIYDEREEIVRQGQSIAAQQDSIDVLKQTLDDVHAFITKTENELNVEIAAINARGGATLKEQASIAAQQRALQSRIDQYNADAKILNDRIKTLNAQVAQYNTTAGHSFRAGEYISDASGKRINIYAYVNERQLKSVLAHELGHALGLDHNDDPTSIMYSETEDGSLTPSEKDIESLQELCGI